MSKKVKTEKPKKEKKEMTEENKIIANQMIKAATAVVCAAALCFSISSSVGKMSDAMVKSAEASAKSGASQSSSESYSDSSSDTVSSDSISDSSTDTETPADSSSDTSSDTTSDSSASADTGNAGSAVEAKTEAAKKDPNGTPQSKAEIIAYCNKALNDAKAAKVGYTKTFVRKGGDNLPSIVSSVIAQNKTTTAKKGDAKIVDDFPAAGFEWSSKLRESDVKSADLKTNGQYYEITLKLIDETNPAKGEASSYGRVMSVIDANDAKEMVSAVKTINMNYHDGYVYAKVDSKTGKLVKAEFSAAADINATLSIIGDLSAQNLISTETFTDIQW